MKCSNCSTQILPHEERCHVCNQDAGFPNVRAAEDLRETQALHRRAVLASQSADARGAMQVCVAFRDEVEKNSQAVLARNLGFLDSFIREKNALYINFHDQVRSGARIPENNGWDAGRVAAESTVNPIYFDKITFTALSLDGFGVLWWGDYSMTIKETHIARRTTVFEENPFIFCERYRLVAGKPCPPGFRATWYNRAELAFAKLAGRLTPATKQNQFAPILIAHGSSREHADFIECHVYGRLSHESVQRVIGPKPKTRHDQVIWRSVVSALRRAGVVVEEV